jgi:hypothetical protein
MLPSRHAQKPLLHRPEQQSPPVPQALPWPPHGMVVVVEVLVVDVCVVEVLVVALLEVVGGGRVVVVGAAQMHPAVHGRPSGHGLPSHSSRTGSTRPSPHAERTAVNVFGGRRLARRTPVSVVHAGAAILPTSRTFSTAPQWGHRVLTTVNAWPALVFTTAGPQASMESSPGMVSTASVAGVGSPGSSGASLAAPRKRPPGQGPGRGLESAAGLGTRSMPAAVAAPTKRRARGAVTPLLNERRSPRCGIAPSVSRSTPAASGRSSRPREGPRSRSLPARSRCSDPPRPGRRPDLAHRASRCRCWDPRRNHREGSTPSRRPS